MDVLYTRMVFTKVYYVIIHKTDIICMKQVSSMFDDVAECYE